MTHSALLEAIYTKISGIATLPTILYPNRIYGTLPSECVRIRVMPIPTATATYDGGILQSGLIQCDCITEGDKGELYASEIADKIINALPNGTVIGGNLKVNRPPYASGGFNLENGSYVIPVTVQYKVLDK